MNSWFFSLLRLFWFAKDGQSWNTPINHLADLFEGILTDNDNPLCQALWKELERRGWEIEQTLKGTLR